MTRLIDADALPIKYDGHTVSVWKVDLDNAPTIDAVEVVRCKDCKLHDDCSIEDIFKWVKIKNTFCCVGERKDD